MPLTERDPNISGRNRRTSNVSATSKDGLKASACGPSPETSTLPTAPGVLSMLRTSTELGDIGAPGTQSNRFLASDYRQQRRSHATLLSQSSSKRSFTGSHVSRHSSTRSGRAPSMNSIRTGPNRQGLVNSHANSLSSMPPMGPPRTAPRGTNGHSRNGRSLTMTQVEIRLPHTLPNHRSLTSLRNHGPTPRPRSPFMYPRRLKRPGYRPSSPATSDVTRSQHSRTQHAHSDIRASSASPFMRQEPHYFSYRQGPNRSAPMLPINYYTANLARKLEGSASVSDPSSSSASTQQGEIPPSVIIHQHTTIVQSLGSAVSSPPPGYYDYSEQFERTYTVDQQDVFQGSEKEVARSRAAGHLSLVDAEELPAIAELPASEVAELPASPVVRRLTRELVKAVIDVTSDDQSESDDHKTATASDSKETPNLSSPPTPEPAEARLDLITSPPDAPVMQDSSISGPTTASTASDASRPASASVRDFASSSPVPVSVLSNGSVTETASSSEQSNTISDSPATSTRSESGLLKSTRLLVRQLQPNTSSNSLRRRSATVALPAASDIPTLPANLPVTHPPSGFSHGDLVCHTPSQAAQLESVAGAVSKPHQSSGSQHLSKPDLGMARLQQPGPDSAKYGQEHSARPDSVVYSLDSLESQTEEAGQRVSHATTDLLQNARKTFARHLSALEDMRNAARLSHDTTSSGNSTTDLRFSSLRYPVTHLSDLKEESQEDISSTNLRSLGYSFRVSKPGALIVSGESATRPTESSTADRLGLIELSRPLGEVRTIPSLNFSRSDLFTKLNDALNKRSSFSREGTGERNVPSIYAPVPERLASSLLLTDRYNSFFVKDVDSTAAESSEERVAAEPAANLPERPLSAADIDLIAQVNRLSVPSVSGLTQRFSELLPSLKRCDPDGHPIVDGPVERSASASQRPITLASARASSEFRALAAAADMVAMSRSSNVKSEYLTNKIAEDVEALGLMKALPALPDDSNEMYSTLSAGSSRARPTTTSLDDVCNRISIAELEAPLPAKLCESWSAQGGRDVISAEQNGKVNESPSAVLGTPTGSRPWNLDESYPWSDTAPTIEMTVPAPTQRRSTSKIARTRLRRSHSASELPQGDTSLSPRSPTVVSDTACLGGSHEQKRKNSKRSILGSLSRKMGLRREAFNRSGFPNGPDLLRPGDTRSFEPGDRYPTSGLTPPAVFNLEEARSFFSDDSERTERGGSFRKRLTALKRARLPAPRPSRTLSRPWGDEYMGSIGDEDASVFGRDWDTYPGVVRPRDYAVGMGKMEFRARKVVERIKSIWFKSGDLLRSMSGRKKAGHHAWDRESDLYSGT